jgi:hypothetical protein
MSLKEYKRKRNLKETAKPDGDGKPSRSGEFNFVVQDNFAHVHLFDLRRGK